VKTATSWATLADATCIAPSNPQKDQIIGPRTPNFRLDRPDVMVFD
jgi:hypothetical protein